MASNLEGDFGLHSFRSGGASAAAENDVDTKAYFETQQVEVRKGKKLLYQGLCKNRLIISQNLGI